MSALFEPLTLRSVTVPNRVWMASMCQYSAAPEGPEQGVPTDWHLAHLGARAVGGVGLALFEATAVSADGRISPYDLGLWNDRQQEAFARINQFLSAHGTVPGVQIAHAGRKASTERTWVRRGAPLAPGEGHGWQPVGPSPLPFDEASTTPTELSRDEIQALVRQFADTARRAHAAGFKTVEVHGAHGYLINEFLSPYSNHRTDEYGGSFEGRTRFALEVVEAVREVWPDELPLLFRISATDWLTENPDDGREGWTGDDTVRFAKELHARGVDLLDTSTGGNAPGARITAEPNYQVPIAERVKKETDLPVGAVGLITDPHQAEEIVASGRADAVLLARELLRSPYWANEAAKVLGAEPRWPNPYHRAV
ncbi:NADH:flavin oxidoreductase/NADH oxidase [Streptomyces iconiensis]|uniref:NADH:flavin oxidoreductase/NADH oxidase n=1 Tax=Streptomyces iconiensis TaxID=1384038 RepID=A0ABT6ZN38_9ACTN|nr:NADH:flavin oxidoreductase/NADH oxidase [Streptomyces iconiensis]MDJ1130471.1 NADH:flavin oxidoreductase/NADH oxidase [Streptomyces iconiensis]